MKGPGDPLGKLLVRSGAFTQAMVEDVLSQQRRTLPFASLAYSLGLADEEVLVRSLAKQAGVPGVVFDGSAIDLELLRPFNFDWLVAERVLPVYQEERRLFLAVADPERALAMARQLEFEHDVTVVIHVALHITLSRAIRQCVAAVADGKSVMRGIFAADASAPMFVVAAISDTNVQGGEPSAREALQNITKEVRLEELLGMDPSTSVDETTNSFDTARVLMDDDYGSTGTGTDINLDGGRQETSKETLDGPKRILLVDDDFASRHLLVKELQPEGYQTASASSGSEAVRMLKDKPPDAVILDVMLPEIDGFQICRAIKQSKRYKHIPVILMSAVIDSGQVSDKVLRQYGADAYFEKPLATERIRAKLRELLQKSSGKNTPRVRDQTFTSALERYRRGDLVGAMEQLRLGIEDDPLSTKHHFVLANLLQKEEELYQAIDEYEIVVDLRPDYFPALTRLAYLYYKKGYSAKAIDTWRRALPFCPEAGLRQNIEVFMRKLIASMQSPVS